jgi:hypothetical protein
MQREMGCTRAELMDWLPGATGQAPLRIDGGVVTVLTHGGSVRICMQEKAPRRIGSIALPVLAVTFCFRDLDEAMRADFLRFFDLYTRRGGG